MQNLSQHSLFTEQTRQNNGKASILDDATRLLHHLLTEVKCLRRENVALLSESHYVSLKIKYAFFSSSVLINLTAKSYIPFSLFCYP